MKTQNEKEKLLAITLKDIKTLETSLKNLQKECEKHKTICSEKILHNEDINTLSEKIKDYNFAVVDSYNIDETLDLLETISNLLINLNH